MRPAVTALCASLALLALPAAAEVREALCSPEEVLVADQRIEVICREATALGDRGRLSEVGVGRFAYPLISQSYQPQLGNQPNLSTYYLDQLQAALVHDRKVRIWFETELGTNTLWGCDPAACRALVACALTDQPRSRLVGIPTE